MLTNSMAKRTTDNYFPLPGLFTLSMGLWFWVIFYPGNLSPDSLYQYSQVITGNYSDIAPPIMSAVLALIIKAGGDIETLTLIQVVAGVFGFRSLVIRIFEGFGINKQIADYISVFLLALFLSPISPLAFYLVTFWKDSWFAILLLWVCSFLIRLYTPSELTHSTFLKLSLLSAGLFAIALLTRHNAIVVWPFWAYTLWVISKKKKQPLHIFLIAILFSFVFKQGLDFIQRKALDVKPAYPAQDVMAMDLVGMLVLEPELHEYIPYTSQHLASDYKERYVFGQDYPFFGAKDDPLLNFVIRGEKNQDLVDEYYRVILKFPFTWVRVKIIAFYEVIRPDKSHNPIFYSGIDENNMGLMHNKAFKYQRNDFKSLANFWLKNTPLRWISGIGMVWIVVGLLELFVSSVLWIRSENINALFGIALLTIPLSYCGSYLIAAIDVDFRFIYPAMLLIQIFTASILISLLIQLVKEKIIGT